MAIVLPVTGSLNWDVTLDAALTELDTAVTALQGSALTAGTAVSGDLSGTLPGPSVTSTHLIAPLPVAQGGTGSTTQNYVDLTTAQTVAGNKTYTGMGLFSSTAGTNLGAIGTNTGQRLIGASGSDVTSVALGGIVTGDTFDRLRVQVDGNLSWGPGTATRDTNLYRGAANQLNTDDALVVALAATVGGLATFNGQVTENSTTDRTAYSAVYTTTANVNNAAYSYTATATTGRALQASITGDTVQRYVMGADGGMSWGAGGSTARDVSLGRTSTATLGVTNGDLAVLTAGKGLKVAESAGNAKMGVSVLVAGTVTVANTAVNANSRIYLTPQITGGTAGFLNVGTITPGTSFVIHSSNAADTSTVAWLIVDHT